MALKVIIVDDDKLVTASLKTILKAEEGFEIPAVGFGGAEAVALYRKYRPDVLLSDIRMCGMTGLEAAAEILKEDPAANILFLTTFSDEEYIVEALRIGARGYILKQDFESIAPALRAVKSGQSVFGGEIVQKLPDLMGKGAGFDYEAVGIGGREQELIRLVAEGLNNKELAEAMFLSEGTVRNYLSNILEKLGLRNRTELAIFYYKNK